MILKSADHATWFGMTPRKMLGALVIVSGLLRLLLASSVGPSNDEAYYSLFTHHLDWSFFDHPPILALVAALGSGALGGLAPALGLRLGFIVLFAGSTVLMARVTARFFGAWAGCLAALALNLTGFFGIVVGTLALPDGPLVFFWLLTLDCLAGALEQPNRLSRWAWVGLAWGGALLSKYHAVFLPAGALLFLLLDASVRPVLRRPGPYLAFALGLLVFLPVLYWNAAHHWVSFTFQGGRALGGSSLRLDRLATAIGGQAAYLFPWMWVLCLLAVAREVRRSREQAALGERFLLCQAVWPLIVFTAVACRQPVLPHWSLVAFLPLLALVGKDWNDRLKSQPSRLRPRLAMVTILPVVIAMAAALQARTGFFQRGGRGTLGLVSIKQDPTLDLYGWDQVARELRRRGLLAEPQTFLFTSTWYLSGQLAFATQGALPVLCYHPHDARGFAFWSKPDQWVGQTGILVALDQRSIEPGCFDQFFNCIELIGEFPILRGGVPVHRIRLFRCIRQSRPFPFDESNVLLREGQIARAKQDGKRRS